MSLSSETIDRINHASRHEERYQPNDQVKRIIGSTTLNMVVAPAAMGKTLVMRRAAELDNRFGRSSTLSTRQPRPDDEPGMFRMLEHTNENIDLLLDKISNGELVQYKFHPTEQTFYGSEPIDHPYEHNMLATLSGAITQLQQVGFKNTSVFGLVAPPAEWHSWFSTRYPELHPQRLKRLQEAEISYSDLLSRDDVIWIVNREGDVDGTAARLIDAKNRTSDESEEALTYVHRILHLIHDTKIREQSTQHE